MLNKRKGDGRSSSWKGRRRKLALGATALGSIAAVGLALPAGAAVTPPTGVTYPAPAANNVIVGSGSSTTYNMMQSLDTLFNQVPGCVITSGSVSGAPSKANQELDFSCEQNSSSVTLEQVPGNAWMDNPINDVATEAPAIGSSNGIAQLELDRNSTATGIGTTKIAGNAENVSLINFARSSRDISSANDVQGLNFVAYAKDGVSPLVWSKVGSTVNPLVKAAVSTITPIPGTGNTTVGLTKSELQGIYSGTIYDWGQLGAKTSGPIYVYSAQEGSGTQATFKTFLSGTPSDPSAVNPVNCTDPVAPGTTVFNGPPTKTKPVPTFEKLNSATPPALVPLTVDNTTCHGADVIFENEDASIIANATTPDAIATAWETQNGFTSGSTAPIGNSIFFYSLGKYNLQCEGLKQQVQYFDKSKAPLVNIKVNTNCGSEALPTALAGSKLFLPWVNGVQDNPANVLGGTTPYPITRFLYNIYSNGSNPNIPVATAATLNYVSEAGFLCKAQTTNGLPSSGTQIVDPFTGLWYHTEIFDSIVNSGFIPLTATAGATEASVVDGPAVPENASSGADGNTAYALLSAGTPQYGASYLNSSVPTATNPSGFCLVFNTDGDTAGQ
jgi:ABC-type phosphate transport system substrate-binding protein